MKKTRKAILFFGLIVLLLLLNLAVAASATDAADRAELPLEERLIGTWRWDSEGSSWLIIFRADGTMLDGPAIFRTSYNWQIVGGRLIVDGIDWNIHMSDNAFTVARYGQRINTHTYVWYSDSTEGETTSLPIGRIISTALIAGAVILVVAAIILIVALRMNQRKA